MATNIHMMKGVVTGNASSFKKMSREVMASARQMAQSWKRAGADMASAGRRMAAVTLGVGVAVSKLSVDFEQQMIPVRNLVLDMADNDFERLKESVRGLSKEFGRDTGQIAQGMFDVISAGADNAEMALDAMRKIMPAVIAGGAEMGDSVALVANVVNAYGGDWSKVGKIMDLIFETNRVGVTNIRDMSATLGQVTDTASTLGVSLEDLFGNFAAITKGAPSTGIAVTRLSGLLAALAKGGEEMDAIFANMPQQFESTGHALRELGLQATSQAIFDEMGGDVGRLLNLMGRKEGVNALLGITGANAKRATDMVEGMGTVGSVAAEALASAMAKPGERFKQMREQALDVARTIGDNLVPELVKIGERIGEAFSAQKTTLVDALSAGLKKAANFVGNIVIAVADMVPQIIQAAEVFGVFLGGVMDFISAHPKLAAVLVLLGAANMLGITRAVTSLGLALFATGKFVWTTIASLRAYAVSVGIAKFATVALQAALIGMGIGVVMLAITGLVLAFQKLEGGVDGVVDVLKPLREAWAQLQTELLPVILELANEIAVGLRPVMVELGEVAKKFVGQLVEFARESGPQFVRILGDAVPLMTNLARIFGTLAEISLKRLVEQLQLILDTANKIGEAATKIPIIGDIFKDAPTGKGISRKGRAAIAEKKKAAAEAKAVQEFNDEVDRIEEEMAAEDKARRDSPVDPKFQRDSGIDLSKIAKDFDLPPPTGVSPEQWKRDTQGIVQDARRRSSAARVDKMIAAKEKAGRTDMGGFAETRSMLSLRDIGAEEVKNIINSLGEDLSEGFVNEQVEKFLEMRDSGKASAEALDEFTVKLIKGADALEDTEKRRKRADEALTAAGFGKPEGRKDLTGFLQPLGSDDAQIATDTGSLKVAAEVLADQFTSGKLGKGQFQDALSRLDVTAKANAPGGTVQQLTERGELAGMGADINPLLAQFRELQAQLLAGDVTMDQYNSSLSRINQNMQAAEQFADVLKGVGQSLPINQMTVFRARFNELSQQFQNGEMGATTFASAIRNLTNETQMAAQVAERERLAKGNFTQEEFARAMQDRMIAFQRQRFQAAIDARFNNQMAGMGIAVEGVTKRLGGFGGQLRSTGQVAMKDVSKNVGIITNFLSSQRGQIAMLENNIQFAFQRLSVQKTFTAARRVQRDIEVMQAQLAALKRPRAAIVTPTDASSLFRDPGLSPSTNVAMEVNVNMPSMSWGPNEASQMFNQLEREGSRRGIKLRS